MRIRRRILRPVKPCVCDKDLGIDSVSSATCIESNESVHQPNLYVTVSTSACETNPESESISSSGMIA